MYYYGLYQRPIFNVAMSMQPYFTTLVGALTHKEREHCKELARKSLPPAVKKYVLTLLESKPEEITIRDEAFLKEYSESGRRWLRRAAQEFLENALYELYGSSYELRIVLNQIHLAIMRGHSASPFLRPLKRRINEILQESYSLFAVPLPWLLELAYLSLSYPGNAIIEKSPVSFAEAIKLIELDKKRLETVRYAVEHDPFIGESNPETQSIIQRLEDIEQHLKSLETLPFHKTIVSLYGMMALLYDQLGFISKSNAIARIFMDALPELISFLERIVSNGKIDKYKEWANVIVFMAIVCLQVMSNITGWTDEEIEGLKQQVLRLVHVIDDIKETLSIAEIPLKARLSAWLATHGYYDEASELLEQVGWHSLNPEYAFRPIERVDFSVAQFWCLMHQKEWSQALRAVSRLEQIVPQRPLYYYLTELLRFVVALRKNDYELLSSTADRVYHWNRRHKQLFPTLGKVLRFIGLKAHRFSRPSDWSQAVSRIYDLYTKHPFYITNIEKPVHLLGEITNKALQKKVNAIDNVVGKQSEIPLEPLKHTVETMVKIARQ